jgi:hypothetical protein
MRRGKVDAGKDSESWIGGSRPFFPLRQHGGIDVEEIYSGAYPLQYRKIVQFIRVEFHGNKRIGSVIIQS